MIRHFMTRIRHQVFNVRHPAFEIKRSLPGVWLRCMTQELGRGDGANHGGIVRRMEVCGGKMAGRRHRASSVQNDGSGIILQALSTGFSRNVWAAGLGG